MSEKSRPYLDEGFQVPIGQHSRNQQHAVGTVRTRLEQLVGLHYELLADEGQAYTSLSDVPQVLEAALEVLDVRQHAQAGRASRLICLGYLNVGNEGAQSNIAV